MYDRKVYIFVNEIFQKATVGLCSREKNSKCLIFFVPNLVYYYDIALYSTYLYKTIPITSFIT